MISYVKPFWSRPCWWMPASWAKALRPTTALFGCGNTPITCDSSWLVRKISFELTPHWNATACERTRPAMTISSSAALPARSPIPLMVHSTWPAPASMAASELATARPRSSWQWALNNARSLLGTRSSTARRVADAAHGLLNPLRRARDPRFDHCHAEGFELAGEPQLRLRRHGVARRLLAVPQRGVEDDDVSPHGDRSAPFPIGWVTKKNRG